MTNAEMPVDFIIDFESYGLAPEGAFIDLAIVLFKDDPHNPPTFQELVASSKRIKFDISSQRKEFPRVFDRSTIEWWQQQSEAARAMIKAAPTDVNLKVGMEEAIEFIRAGTNKKTSLGWCRGPSFDFPMYLTALRQIRNTREVFDDEPCFFWNQRDIRTAVERTLMTRGMTECPLPMGTLDGFVAHNSVHDCAKDILMLIYAQRYALGLEDCPMGDEVDPRSVKKGR
ncbi:MAG: 3'-5' exoribonuclease domain-containing protein [Cetobacterium sp.]|uniref:3'-5' exoribonuclease domain-containing protein n=1 Tax=Cetobacterium sp. TaxID=2071632 RepID=UPI003EE558D3